MLAAQTPAMPPVCKLVCCTCADLLSLCAVASTDMAGEYPLVAAPHMRTGLAPDHNVAGLWSREFHSSAISPLPLLSCSGGYGGGGGGYGGPPQQGGGGYGVSLQITFAMPPSRCLTCRFGLGTLPFHLGSASRPCSMQYHQPGGVLVAGRRRLLGCPADSGQHHQNAAAAARAAAQQLLWRQPHGVLWQSGRGQRRLWSHFGCGAQPSRRAPVADSRSSRSPCPAALTFGNRRYLERGGWGLWFAFALHDVSTVVQRMDGSGGA
jgi:hypothetical protein